MQVRWKRHGFDPWLRKVSWRRAQQPTPLFLPGESYDRGAWQAAVHVVTQSRTWLKWLSTLAITQFVVYLKLTIFNYSLWMVTAAMKLKDAYPLEEKLWRNWQHIKKQRHHFADKGPYSSYVFFSLSEETCFYDPWDHESPGAEMGHISYSSDLGFLSLKLKGACSLEEKLWQT